MTHPISPLAFRLGVSTNWWTVSHIKTPNLPQILHTDDLIRNLIQGVYLQLGVFTSPIILKRSPSGSLHIHLFFWDSSPSVSPVFPSFPSLSYRSLLLSYLARSRRKKISKISIAAFFLTKLLAKLLNLPSGGPSLQFHLSEIPSPVYNAKILCDYLAYRITLNPYYHKPVVMEALRAVQASGR